MKKLIVSLFGIALSFFAGFANSSDIKSIELSDLVESFMDNQNSSLDYKKMVRTVGKMKRLNEAEIKDSLYISEEEITSDYGAISLHGEMKLLVNGQKMYSDLFDGEGITSIYAIGGRFGIYHIGISTGDTIKPDVSVDADYFMSKGFKLTPYRCERYGRNDEILEHESDVYYIAEMKNKRPIILRIMQTSGSQGAYKEFSIFRNPGDGFYTADKKIFSQLSMKCDVMRHDFKHAFSKNTISDEKYIDLYKYGKDAADCVKRHKMSYSVSKYFNECSKVVSDIYKKRITECSSKNDEGERIKCEAVEYIIYENSFSLSRDGLCGCFVLLNPVTGNFIDPDNKLDFPQGDSP